MEEVRFGHRLTPDPEAMTMKSTLPLAITGLVMFVIASLTGHYEAAAIFWLGHALMLKEML